MGKRQWPPWWSWELKLSGHVLRRMVERDLTEVDLRIMLDSAGSYRRDVIEGRWVIETRHLRRPWEVVVEPDLVAATLVVVTAYPVWE